MCVCTHTCARSVCVSVFGIMCRVRCSVLSTVNTTLSSRWVPYRSCNYTCRRRDKKRGLGKGRTDQVAEEKENRKGGEQVWKNAWHMITIGDYKRRGKWVRLIETKENYKTAQRGEEAKKRFVDRMIKEDKLEKRRTTEECQLGGVLCSLWVLALK